MGVGLVAAAAGALVSCGLPPPGGPPPVTPPTTWQQVGAGTTGAISGSTLSIERTFTVPKGTAGIEGPAFTAPGAATVAVWSTRGSSSAPAKVFAATFEPSTGSFGQVATATVTVPFPTANVRHISDLTLIGPRIVASSASDPGPSGPFDSALYDIGTLALAGGWAVLTMGTPRSLGTFPGHKVEGIACSGTAGLLGTDDENQGGWVRSASFCTT